MTNSLKVDNFEVLREMAKKNMDIALVPLSQITHMNKVKAGCQITIGAPSETMTKIALGSYGGGLLIFDSRQFDELKKEMESK